MGLARNFEKGTNKNRILLIIGILFLLTSIAFFCKDIYMVTQFEYVESTMTVIHKPKKGYHAYVSYEYHGAQYEDKALSYYNGFVMKNGKKYTILINPAKPETPYTTAFSFDILFLITGILCLYGSLKKESNSFS